MSVTRLAEKTNLSAATVYRITQALVQEGFLIQDSETAKYSLGGGLIRLGDLARRSLDLPRVAAPYAQQVAAVFGENTYIETLNKNGQINTILHIPSTSYFHSSLHLDASIPPHWTSTGKLILAHASQSKLNEILAKGLSTSTSKTIADVETLLIELENVRKRGYATNIEELEEGYIAVGAPIRDSSGEVIAAISTGGPSFRVTEKMVPAIAEVVMEAAASISSDLGFDQDILSNHPFERNPDELTVEKQQASHA